MTYKQVFVKYLPKEMAQRAIQYCDIEFEEFGGSDSECVCPEHALVNGFVWQWTEEGQKFWESVENIFVNRLAYLTEN